MYMLGIVDLVLEIPMSFVLKKLHLHIVKWDNSCIESNSYPLSAIKCMESCQISLPGYKKSGRRVFRRNRNVLQRMRKSHIHIQPQPVNTGSSFQYSAGFRLGYSATPHIIIGIQLRRRKAEVEGILLYRWSRSVWSKATTP